MERQEKENGETAIEQQRELELKEWDSMQSIKSVLESKLEQSMSAIPEGFNQQRFVMNCLAVMKGDLAKWKGFKMGQIAEVFLKGAFLGLDFFNGECYAITYGNEINFQTDYKGEIKLAKKYSRNPIKDIYAKVVRDGDEFVERIEGGVQTVYFNPVPFSDQPIIGAFAVVVFKDGSMIYETMSKAEIEGIRNGFSKAKNSPAWTKTPGEMYKKTVLRRLLKFVDLDFDNSEQDAAFVDGGDANFAPSVNYAPAETHNPFAKKAKLLEQAQGQEAAQEMEGA